MSLASILAIVEGDGEVQAVPVLLAKCEYEAWFLASIESIVGSRTLSRDVWLHRRPQSPSAVPRSGSASVYTAEIYHDIDGNPLGLM